ncbi:MAG: hypothetical protein IKL82_06325 [Clostridia bacterium]|nr:hypothetical protein [Clostridia bacterium]
MLENEESKKIFESLKLSKIKIEELDPSKAVNRLAVYEYLKDRPSLFVDLNGENEEKFVKYCIERNHKLFLALDKKQYTNELAEKYLVARIKESKNFVPSFLDRSYDNKLVFNINYQTCDGEEVIYFDSDIETVTFLFAKIDLSFKVLDVIATFEKFDIGVEHIGYNRIVAKLTEWTTQTYRKIVTELVTNKKVGIYKLNVMHEDIEQLVKAELNKLLKGCLSVESVLIRKLSVSSAVSDILQRQGLELLSERSKKKSDLEYEKRALENYAKKAEIHTQNPQFSAGLTEAEKDYALDRYIKKRKFDLGINDGVPEETVLATRNNAYDNELKKKTDKPTLILDGNTKKKPWILLYVLSAFAFMFALTSASAIHKMLIILGVAVAFAGWATALLIRDKQDDVAETLTDKQRTDEYNALQEEYKSKANDK